MTEISKLVEKGYNKIARDYYNHRDLNKFNSEYTLKMLTVQELLTLEKKRQDILLAAKVGKMKEKSSYATPIGQTTTTIPSTNQSIDKVPGDQSLELLPI